MSLFNQNIALHSSSYRDSSCCIEETMLDLISNFNSACFLFNSILFILQLPPPTNSTGTRPFTPLTPPLRVCTAAADPFYL